MITIIATCLIGGCVSNSPQPTNSIKPEIALVTALVIGEADANDRTRLAQEVYNAANLAEKLLNKGVSLQEIKPLIVQAAKNDKEKAILSAVLDYINDKYQVTVGLTDLEKQEIVRSAIDGVKSASSVYLGR